MRPQGFGEHKRQQGSTQDFGSHRARAALGRAASGVGLGPARGRVGAAAGGAAGAASAASVARVKGSVGATGAAVAAGALCFIFGVYDLFPFCFPSGSILTHNISCHDSPGDRLGFKPGASRIRTIWETALKRFHWVVFAAGAPGVFGNVGVAGGSGPAGVAVGAGAAGLAAGAAGAAGSGGAACVAGAAGFAGAASAARAAVSLQSSLTF